MRIAIIGTEDAGLVTGACLADAGNQVVCIDNQQDRIRDLQKSLVPFCDPGLSVLLDQCRQQKSLRFSCDLADGVANAQVVFLTIDTHLSDDKQIDITGLLNWSCKLATVLSDNSIVVVQSDVPPGTCDRIQNLFDSLSPPNTQRRIHVVYNPTFLSESNAVASFQAPSQVVIGCLHSPTQVLMKTLYAPFIETGAPLLLMDWRSAEFSKYAYSAILATRISVMNELACIAGQVNANISAVSKVLEQDARIAGQGLQAGAGYGGTSVPTHIQSLIQIAQNVDEPAYLLRSLERVNHRQTRLMFETISAYFSHMLRGRCLAVWGLTAEPKTDDISQSPSLSLIQGLLAAGARVQAYDPFAANNTKKAITNDRLTLADNAQDACRGADALIVMTECEEFRQPDFSQVAQSLSTSALFDAHNMYKASTLQQYQLRHYHLWQKRPAGQAYITH